MKFVFCLYLLQPRAVLTVGEDKPGELPSSCTVGDFCTIGEGSSLTACTVQDYATVGAHSGKVQHTEPLNKRKQFALICYFPGLFVFLTF